MMERLCVCLCLILGLASPIASADNVREARMLRGRVQTTAAAHGRSMLSQPAPQGVRAYLVGYDPASKAEVAAKLKSVGAFIAAPIPDDHFLVRAQPEHIAAVLEAHPGTTAGILPKEVRVEQTLETLAQRVSTIGATVAWEAGFLKDYSTHRAANGEVQLELDVHGLPFAPMTVMLLNPSDPVRRATDAAAAEWAMSLQTDLAKALSVSARDACYPTFTKTGLQSSTRVRLCLGQLESALNWLTGQDTVIFVEAVHLAYFQNLQAASSMQTGSLSKALGQPFSGNMNETFPLWAAGLDGSNQVVGVGDTGIDLDSCFFWDANHQDYQSNQNKQTTLTSRTTSQLQVQVYDGNAGDSPHRKVRSYIFGSDEFGNSVDDTGHGTHVAGTVAGETYNNNPLENPNLATGVAPKARVAFIDLQGTSLAEQSADAMRPPAGDIPALFDLLRQQDVKISTNSWGFPATFNNYTSQCQDIDGYTWLRDMLVIFAAGNAGFEPTPERGTVAVPAICKNSLAVGATDNWRARDLDDDTLQNSNFDQKTISTDVFNGEGGLVFHVATNLGKQVLFSSSFQPPVSGFSLINWDQNNHIEAVLDRDTEYDVTFADPPGACSELSNDVNGKIVMFNSDGGCGPDTKAANVAGAGAAAGIYFATGVPTGNSPDDTPFANLDFDETVSGFIQTAIVTAVPKIDQPHEHIMALSSYGPIGFQDNEKGGVQIKPEIAAPGVTLSASQSGTFSGQADLCNVDVLQGTSMAAPGVAGAAAIVRQYFMDGFYPTGVKGEGMMNEPSASLVRAVLLAGAQPMTGIEERTGADLRARETPNNSEGYGRLNLNRSLPTKGVNDDWALMVFNGAPFDSEGRQTFEVNTTSTGPLIVMLSWMDLPSLTGSEAVLIQNLDLKVTDGSSTYNGNGVEGGDRHNNNERVMINEPGSKTWTIEVTARSLFLDNGPQSFALVALGGIQGPAANATTPQSSDASPSGDFTIPNKRAATTADERQLQITFPFEDPQTAQQIRNSLNPDAFISAATIDLNGLDALPPGSSITFESIESSSRRRSLKQDNTVVAVFRLKVDTDMANKTPYQVSQDILNAVENGDASTFAQLEAFGVQVESMTGTNISPSASPDNGAVSVSVAGLSVRVTAAVVLLAALLI